ncbi:hypothetical protein [Flavobacterium sp.]|uniref:hypothetical protein n=1 Tax=Flavobacterium sp. TaxID=239 RepID=UPI0037C01878
MALLCFTFSFSQTDLIENEIDKIQNRRTGNFKDAFYNIIQLTTKNLTEDEKSLELNTTLFKIMYNADLKNISDLTINKSYFLRNFQINAKVNLDKDYKYKGFSGGFTYAIVNGRDKATVNLAKGIYGKQREKFITAFQQVQSRLAATEITETELDLLNKASDDILNDVEYDITGNPYYDRIIEEFKTTAATISYADGKSLTSTDISDHVKYLKQVRKSEMDKIDGKALWTLAADGSTNTDGKFNKCSVSSVYLKGIDKSGDQIDIRGTFTYDDDTLVNMPRTTFNGKAGLNFVLLRNTSENVSCFEVKALGEYTKVYKNVLPDEDDEIITANAEFRIRLANDFWIPITVKYDIDNANLLGFLNLTYNFGG